VKPNPRIIIAEDNRINLLLVSTIISKSLENVEIREALDGREALNLYQEWVPDLIFMDIQMPELNGYEATEAIRSVEVGQNLKRVPIVALTAGAEKSEKDKCTQAGMDDYISKPFTKEILVAILNKWL